MGKIDWDELAKKARENTNAKFREEISTLLRLNDNDIKSIISKSEIDNEHFLEIIKIVKDRSLANNKKAEAIQGIDNGLRAVIGIVDKII
ncbi:hypothetical protein [Polaribacter glomeratus]|uniref:Uncharacterized protein n=1 Tax=Polaribacter glomeratus TaxID=102 RepID=A0A2S7WFX5_9FLAO|nr:hypothetical protein [Polaribacter glomeratus]PQJ76515.1 hypothetical protein BTO16_11460 [Polaribacter glomeratus]TXD64187.1 hypothetical protein ESX12_15865 [Polaribacter glomeratus]